MFGSSVVCSTDVKVGRLTLSWRVAFDWGVVWSVRCLGGDFGFERI
jgi:hypothetical protein